MTQNTYHKNMCFVCFSSCLATVYFIFIETQGNSLRYEEVFLAARFTLQQHTSGVKVWLPRLLRIYINSYV